MFEKGEDTMLKVRDLGIEFKDFKLEPVSLNLDTGMVLGIFGANGSGKTTLIKLLTWELKRQSGDVEFDGKKEYRDVLSYMPSYFPYEQYSTVREVIFMYKSIYQNFDEDLGLSYLNKFDIKLKDKPRKLSLGTRQKLMLALVLASNAKLIILDEPTDGIDIFLRDEIFEILQDYLYDKDVTLIIASHQIESYEPIIDEILYLEDGKTLIQEDAISFRTVATQYLDEDLERVSLKDFSYLRQKGYTYDQDRK